MNTFMVGLIIIFAVLSLYFIIDRICLCFERCAVAKAWGMNKNEKHGIEPKALKENIDRLTKEMLNHEQS